MTLVTDQNQNNNDEKKKRKIISQADIPAYSLSKALEVASALYNNYGKDPAKPLQVAQAMNVSPNSSTFKMKTGSAIAYGLTEGGYNAANISLTQLGKRIVAPTTEGDDISAKRAAVVKPRIISEFLNRYNNSPFPSDKIAINILEEKGVPRDRAKSVFDLIVENAEEVGFLTEIKGKKYVNLDSNISSHSNNAELEINTNEQDAEMEISLVSDENKKDEEISNKVFITHGKNVSFLEPIKKLLSFGGLVPIIATEQQTVSQPVPEKVMNSMRDCGAAIIHIDDEKRLLDSEAKEHVMPNLNVLIEIGAAMALYGNRFILLVKDGTQLPSNLQGLYEVRYTGDKLDSEVTIKLLEAINDMKSRPLPA